MMIAATVCAANVATTTRLISGIGYGFRWGCEILRSYPSLSNVIGATESPRTRA